jgi:UDP-N-acetylglucosamine--N-acetylmuramyl-(pentapeptide) pyrophosphoryl-undecaprenol N-acetylglucosamine transferase
MRGMTTLLVCSAGGHLKQLHRLLPRLGLNDVMWMTYDSGLSRSLLEGENVVFIDAAEPRQVKPLVKSAPRIHAAFRHHFIERVVSTGASPALAVFPHARLRGIPCHYIESATRLNGPSLTGKICARMPGVKLYTQHEQWANSSWIYRGSVFDGFKASAAFVPPVLKRAVVTLGTSESYGFRRLVENVLRVLPEEVEVLWQVGSTDVSGLGIEARASVPARELDQAIADADVVIAHSGTGAAITAIESGHCPVLVPRRKQFHEHVDDHQLQTAEQLSKRGLAVAVEADELTLDHLMQAAATDVYIDPGAAPFVLR